jgi:hypothetical protein
MGTESPGRPGGLPPLDDGEPRQDYLSDRLCGPVQPELPLSMTFAPGQIRTPPCCRATILEVIGREK